MFKILGIKLRSFMIGLAFGMKKADIEILSSKTQSMEGEGSSSETPIIQEGLMNDLKQGRVTQEVKQLRYKMYITAMEAAKRQVSEVIINDYTGEYDAKVVSKYKKRIKGDTNSIEPIEIGFINNLNQGENSWETLEKIDEKTGKETSKTRISKTNIQIERQLIPKFFIENYVEKLFVRKTDVENEKIIDLYISRYPNPNKTQTKTLVKELDKVLIDKPERTPNFLDFELLSFRTNGCFGVDDHYVLTYEILGFNEIIEYNGYFVIKLKASLIDVYDFISDIYDETQAQKYANKEKREDKVLDYAKQIEEEIDEHSLLTYLKNNNELENNG